MRAPWIGRLFAALALTAGLLAVAPAALAAPPAAAAEPTFNPGRMETVIGTVEAVVRTRASGARAAGVQLRVRTTEGTVPVHVGPAWWSDSQPFQFRRGDKVAVTGSRTPSAGPMVAGTIVRGEDEAIALRDQNGRPLWADSPRR